MCVLDHCLQQLDIENLCVYVFVCARACVHVCVFVCASTYNSTVHMSILRSKQD